MTSFVSGISGQFGSPGAPGFVSPFDLGALAQGQGQSTAAMANRYSQLGLATPNATPTSPGGGGMGTAEQQDLGIAPSLTGGIPAQYSALLGQAQTANLQNPGGVSTSPASIVGALGRLTGK